MIAWNVGRNLTTGWVSPNGPALNKMVSIVIGNKIENTTMNRVNLLTFLLSSCLFNSTIQVILFTPRVAP